MVNSLKNGRDSGPRGKWTLRDVVNFEACASDPTPWKKVWRDGVREQVESAAPATEKDRRRIGFKLMLERMRSGPGVGERVTGSARIVSALLVVVMFLTGVGVVRGLLTDFTYQEIKFAQPSAGETVSKADYAVSIETVTREAKGFNVWILLVVTLGVQWLILLVGVLSYWLWRRWSGSLTVLESGTQWLIRKLSGGAAGAGLWKQMKKRVSGGRGVFGWRLTRLLQSAGIGYNLGLLVGLFGCLWFLHVGYFWETSLPQFGEESLNRVTKVMSTPSGGNFPGRRAISLAEAGHQPELSDLAGMLGGSIPPRQQADLNWSVFFFLSFALYGLLPRVLLWLGAWWMERRALAGLDFQESHHRTLWREVTKVERAAVQSGPADGVVLLDIGGLETETEQLRPFFLQELRVNPEARYSLGTLDQEGEQQALAAARKAALGVVFLVEGWNLSPKQMTVYHTQVREAIGARNMIRYVVMGSEEESDQWKKFVDGLKDSEAEVYRFKK